MTGQPSPQDVQRTHLVAMTREGAGQAPEVGLGDAIIAAAMPAVGAGAGRVAGLDRDQDPTEAFSLVAVLCAKSSRWRRAANACTG